MFILPSLPHWKKNNTGTDFNVSIKLFCFLIHQNEWEFLENGPLWWPCVRHPLLSIISLRNIILLNHMASCNQTLQKWYLRGTLLKVVIKFHLKLRLPWQPIGKPLQKSSCQKPQDLDIWCVASSSEPLTRLFRLWPSDQYPGHALESHDLYQ